MIAHTSHQSNTPSMQRYTKLQILEAMRAIIREADDEAFADLAESLVTDIFQILEDPAAIAQPVKTIITPFGFVPLLGTIGHSADLGPVINWNGVSDD